VFTVVPCVRAWQDEVGPERLLKLRRSFSHVWFLRHASCCQLPFHREQERSSVDLRGNHRHARSLSRCRRYHAWASYPARLISARRRLQSDSFRPQKQQQSLMDSRRTSQPKRPSPYGPAKASARGRELRSHDTTTTFPGPYECRLRICTSRYLFSIQGRRGFGSAWRTRRGVLAREGRTLRSCSCCEPFDVCRSFSNQEISSGG
jgi:hypothetical protein